MCILLVEDDGPVREVVMEMLADAGFDTCEAATSDQAVGLIDQPPKPLALLITDVDLPGGRSGTGLAQLAHRQHPSLPILYITGRPDRIEALGPKEALLAKPFRLQLMIQTVRQLLGSSADLS